MTSTTRSPTDQVPSNWFTRTSCPSAAPCPHRWVTAYPSLKDIQKHVQKSIMFVPKAVSEWDLLHNASREKCERWCSSKLKTNALSSSRWIYNCAWVLLSRAVSQCCNFWNILPLRILSLDNGRVMKMLNRTLCTGEAKQAFLQQTCLHSNKYGYTKRFPFSLNTPRVVSLLPLVINTLLQYRILIVSIVAPSTCMYV